MGTVSRQGLLVLVCLCASAEAWAQGKVSGKVFSDSGQAIGGATVFFTRADGQVAESAKTDGSGKYETERALPDGTYKVRASAGGHDAVERSVSLPLDGIPGEDFVLPERQFLVRWGSRGGLDLTLIQPGSFTFFDRGTDDPDEVDIFEDGKLSASVQLLGVDAVAWTDRNYRVRVGINGGLGLSSVKEAAPTSGDPKATKSVGAALFSVSAFFDFARVARLEGGWIRGKSAGEGGSIRDRDDSALFVGLSLRTQLGNELMKIFR